jgi:4,5-dihydroxyphthalate decarboxylase
VRLSIVLGRHGQVRDLRDGTVAVEGCELEFVDVERMPDAYREMARRQPYDVCEMAPTSYLMAKAAGAPITALPIPMTRRFRHAGVRTRPGSGIGHPKDLEGRRVGVRAYAVTAAVWTRGIYAEEYGLDLGKVTWLTQEEENVPGTALPPNVRRVESLADLAERGELDAAFAGLAGVDLGDELIPDAREREREWFQRTGVYPLHGVIVVRDELLHLAAALFEAFTRAKENYLARAATTQEDLRYRTLSELVGDPLPYGLKENAPSLAALVRYAHRQGLIPAEPPVDRVFHEENR